MRAKPPNTKKKTPPKLYENPPFFRCQNFSMHRPKQPKTLCFKRIRRKNTFWVFWKSAKKPFKRTDAHEIDTILRTTNRARNPFKTSAKREEGNPDTGWGPDSPLQTPFFARIPLLQHIYIYMFRGGGSVCKGRERETDLLYNPEIDSRNHFRLHLGNYQLSLEQCAN